MSNKTLLEEFIAQSVIRLEENTPRVKKCFAQLTDDQVWQRPNASSNSIGNLVLHLCGNMTQYILSGMGNHPDHRVRDDEFSATGGFTKEELLNKLERTVSEASSIITRQTEKDLLRERKVQGLQITGVDIIIHVVEHYSYHTGQIAFWTKLLVNKDLGFYAGMDLNKKNE